ncbi:O-methyltransferase [Facilibium subflavum]|uniref:O-methyltransferase n=1 Tax=Facilibium subflavum TaxID=2219058 RepID=UPI000E64CCF0|nr:class I SAM-dependent methyltransferase [Facilibium subflavum]
MSLETLLKDEKLYQYILDNTLKPLPIQQQMLDKAKSEALSQMITAPEQLQFMQLIIKMIGAQKAIEVGVFKGIGSLAIALALPDNGQLYALDVTDEYLKDYVQYWDQAKISHKVNLKISPAIESLRLLLDQGHQNTFDFVYIDANKNDYPDYYELSYLLICPGGIIVLDNMLRGGKVADETIQEASINATRNTNTLIKNDTRVESVLLPVGDGITIVRKK